MCICISDVTTKPKIFPKYIRTIQFNQKQKKKKPRKIDLFPVQQDRPEFAQGLNPFTQYILLTTFSLPLHPSCNERSNETTPKSHGHLTHLPPTIVLLLLVIKRTFYFLFFIIMQYPVATSKILNPLNNPSLSFKQQLKIKQSKIPSF